jgi:thioredoxin 1
MGGLGATLRRGLRARDHVKQGVARGGVSGVNMASENVKTFTDSNFDEETKQGVVLVDFWAEWCGPCKAIAPVLDDLTREAGGRVTLAKVNVDENHGLAARYGIRSIPTILFVKQGKVVDQVIGAVPKAKLKEKLDALVS